MVNELAIILVDISTSKSSSIFNLVSGKSHSFHELAELIRSYRPYTQVVFKPREIEISHREYASPKVLELFETNINSIDVHIEKILRSEDERIQST